MQDGQISKGKAAECLAELAHSAEDVRLPDNLADPLPDDVIPSERIATLERALAECEAKGAEDTARLDWVFSHRTGQIMEHEGRFAFYDPQRVTDWFDTPRGALDAARKEPK